MIPLLFALTALAAELPRTDFSFLQGKIAFVTDESNKLTVSADCLKNDGSLQCDAIKGLKDISWKKRKKGDQNPGSALCQDQLKGTVVVGKDAAGDENSFCRFPDGSMVDSGSLIHRAHKND